MLIIIFAYLLWVGWCCLVELVTSGIIISGTEIYRCWSSGFFGDQKRNGMNEGGDSYWGKSIQGAVRIFG